MVDFVLNLSKFVPMWKLWKSKKKKIINKKVDLKVDLTELSDMTWSIELPWSYYAYSGRVFNIWQD